MMANKALASAKSADDSIADDLPGEAFMWGEDGEMDANNGIVTSGDELSDNDIRSDTDGGETQEELGEEGTQEPGVGEEPAAAAAKPAAAADAPTPEPAALRTPQAPANEPEAPRQPAFHDMINANFDRAVDHLAGQGTFRLAPKDAEVFDDDTRQVIERQSAAVYLKSVATFSRILHESLPGVVQNLIGVTDTAKTYEDRFYADNGFDRATQDTNLRMIMHNVKTMNPNLNRDQIMEETARIGHAYFGTTPPAKKPNGNGAKPANGQPGQAKVVSRVSKPFATAAKAGGGAPQNRSAPGQQRQKPDPMADLNAMLGFGGDIPD